MTKEQRAEIARCAAALVTAFQAPIDDLGSYGHCDTPEQRDLWISMVAAQSNALLWVAAEQPEKEDDDE